MFWKKLRKATDDETKNQERPNIATLILQLRSYNNEELPVEKRIENWGDWS